MFDASADTEIELEDVTARRARAARRHAALEALTEIGVALAMQLQAEYEASSPAVGALPAGDRAAEAVAARRRDVSLAFSRIGRTVGLCLALGERMDHPEAAAPAKVRAGRAAKTPEHEPEIGTRNDEARDAGIRGFILSATVREVVEQTIEDAVGGDLVGERALRLLDGLDAELDGAAALEKIGQRPLGETIALICEALGVTPDWELWEDEDWAVAEARDEIRGSPYGRPRVGARGAGFDAGLDDEAPRPALHDTAGMGSLSSSP